jgi:hypothetical protein
MLFGKGFFGLLTIPQSDKGANRKVLSLWQFVVAHHLFSTNETQDDFVIEKI